jgi:hypothetical protein
MSKRVVLVDDIDGTDATETIRLSIDGSEAELDLSAKNAAKVRALLQPYLDAGRRPERSYTPRNRNRSSTGSGMSSEHLNSIRAWAGKNGYNVHPKGRIAQHVVDAFDAAHDAEGALTGAKTEKTPAFSAAGS